MDHLLAIGVEPWLCLCYGNELYTPAAKEHFGAVGCPPIHTPEERQAWHNYVRATTEHFAGRIRYYEVWNEPDGEWCWKHGPDAEELAAFTMATAEACRRGDPDCKVLGFAACRFNRFGFMDRLCATGVCRHLDGITYHSYKITDEENEASFRFYDEVRKKYNPDLLVFQGESGTQSRSDGNGALRKACWTPLKQAKYLLRHLIVDLGSGADMASYFSCMDMIEALHGTTGDVSSYLDYGYFGVLGADFDEHGFATGAYTPKPAFYALQNLCSVLCEEYEPVTPPVEGVVEYSQRVWADDYDFDRARSYCFQKPNGSVGLFYWNGESNILTQTYEGTVSLRVPKRLVHEKPPRLTDLLTGDVYELPESMIVDKKNFYRLAHLPITDAPLLLTFGDFMQMDPDEPSERR